MSDIHEHLGIGVVSGEERTKHQKGKDSYFTLEDAKHVSRIQ